MSDYMDRFEAFTGPELAAKFSVNKAEIDVMMENMTRNRLDAEISSEHSAELLALGMVHLFDGVVGKDVPTPRVIEIMGYDEESDMYFVESPNVASEYSGIYSINDSIGPIARFSFGFGAKDDFYYSLEVRSDSELTAYQKLYQIVDIFSDIETNSVLVAFAEEPE